MYQYTVSQWILFFFWYCFVGWIWECCYVSVKRAITKKKWQWVNRGFLNGPFLPIYGSAVVVILIATIPVKDNPVLVFLFGMLAATTLELVTGYIMERLFRVKYWDYSNVPLNFHGYICLFVSLFWGAGSLFIVKILHVPVENMVTQWPTSLCEIASLVLVAVFVYDFSISFREAMDMREILEKLEDYKATVQRLEKRVDAVIAFTPIPDIDDLREIGKTTKDKIIYKLEKQRKSKIHALQDLRERLQLKEFDKEFDRQELLEQLEQQLRGIFSRTNNQVLRVTKHLRRNPGAISKKYAEALKELKALFEDKED